MKHILKALIVVLLAGCSTETVKQKGLTDDFIIMAYSGPPLREVSLERYREIANAGIEYLVPGNGTFNSRQNLKAMELGKKCGVKIIPVDIRLFPFALKPDVSIDTVIINEVINTYKDNPAFAGYVIKDEPHANMFPALEAISDFIRKKDPAHEPLINLFPSYGTLTQLGFDDYREYISSYVKEVKPKLLSYDYYPFRNEGITMTDGWFNDLSVVRDESKKANIPFMVFIQSEGILEGLRVPDRSEILWQVNTALAYGARGVGWFSYWTPEPDQGFVQKEDAAPPVVEHHYHAMIDTSGNRTEIYDYVKEANAYLKKAGKGLLGWDNTAVARFKAGKLVEGSSPVVTPAGERANVVTGTYRKGNRVRVVMANSDCEKPAVFSCNTPDEWKAKGVFASMDAEKETGEFWSLGPGGAVILELKRK